MQNPNNKRVEGGANTCGWWTSQLPSVSTVMPDGSPTNAQRPNVSGAGFARRINAAGQRVTGRYTNRQLRDHFADTIPGALPYDRNPQYSHQLAAQQQAKRVPDGHVDNRPAVAFSVHLSFWAAVVAVVVLTHR